MVLTLFYFVTALLLLVVIHEFGHFLVARCCGVKVLRFSFGFGKVLASWHDKKGTEYAWSLVPLGGYVKMLDEADGEVLEQERPFAFNNQPLWARVAIVLAGPFFNFIFAFVALWLVLVLGIKALAPMIDGVTPGSAAARAGLSANLKILSVDGQKISSWRDFQYELMPFIGSNGASVVLAVKSISNGQEKTISLSLDHWTLDSKHPDLLASLGIVPFIPKIPPIVGEVLPGTPAQSAGLRMGDIIQSVNEQVITDWLDLVDFVKQRPDQEIELGIYRNKTQSKLMVHVGSVANNGHTEGFVGARSERVDWPPDWWQLQQEKPIPAIGTAFRQMIGLSMTTVSLMGRLITGKLPIDSISGPVGIAQGAGDSARSGLPYYLSFLALVSISLGVLNLLPIPMLDGGHLLYYLIEFVCRRPLSEKLKSFGLYCGLVLLVTLMIVAVSNDISRMN